MAQLKVDIPDKLRPKERLKQLIDYSNQVDIDPHVPPLRYYRSGLEMIRMANVYYKEGSLENAYVLYLKFMTLFLEKIRKHPDFNKVPIEVKTKNQAKIREVLPKAEILKQQLLEQYEDDCNKLLLELKKIEAENKKRTSESKKDEISRIPKQPYAIKLPTVIRVPENLDDISYPDPDMNIPTTPQPYIPSAPPPTAPISIKPSVPGNLDDISYPDTDMNIPKTPEPHIPSVPPPAAPIPESPPKAPSPESKPSAPEPDVSLDKRPPDVPCIDRARKPTTIIIEDRPPDVPSIDRGRKPSSISIQDRYDTTALRPVVVPVKVMTLFQARAQKNTFKNIETCGILTGKLEKNELIITHLILPKQKGTSDTCAAMNEEEIFDYQDQHNLITIGWIHTHPTQACFLSSVDVHTHCPYQLLMPEAIAIVCSPKYNETAIFMLTSDGLIYIAKCRKTGFHPHRTDFPLFVVADHVRIENNADLEVLDLRDT